MTAAMWIAVLLPLGGVVVSLLAESSHRAAIITVVFTAAAAVVATAAAFLYVVHSNTPSESAITFWTFNPAYTGTPGNPADRLAGGTVTDFHLQIGIIADGLSTILSAVIAVIATVVQIHSLAYMRATAGFRRHFWQLAVLTAAAMGTFCSANLFTFLIMWGLAGVTGSLIAGHWGDDLGGADGGGRVAIWHRFGDLSLMLAAVIIYVKLAPNIAIQAPPFGQEISDPFNFGVLGPAWHRVANGVVVGSGMRTLVIIAILVLIAAAFRGALLPFNGWLVSTLDGPTPAVGLMQAVAVTGGGACLIARMYPLFLETPHMLSLLALAGAVSAIGGGVLALVETDILRLLSAAAVSHMGLIFLAFGVGGYSAGVFHLFTHALFLAALYLCVANLSVAYKSRTLADIGDIRARMPSSAAALLVATLAASGSLAVGGFWSGRAVLAAVISDRSYSGAAVSSSVRVVLVAAVCLTIALSAAYPVRLYLLVTRHRPSPRRGFNLQRVREVERTMHAPAATLAALAACAGFVGIPGISQTFAQHVYSSGGNGPVSAPLSFTAYALTIFAASAGILLAVLTTDRWATSQVLARLRAVILSAANMQSVIDHSATAITGMIAARLALVDRVIDDRLLLAAGDAVEFGAEGIASRPVTALISLVAVSVIVSAGAAGVLMLVVTGHLPGFRGH